MDYFWSVVALTLFSPVMLVITIIIKSDISRDHLIFKQERIGLQNKPFYMYKFRSMVVQDASKEKEWMDGKERSACYAGRKVYKKNKH